MAKLGTTITMTKSEYRPCIVKERKALFHMWSDIDHNKKYSYNPVKGVEPISEKFTLAIIEYEDGTVGQCYPHEIQFLDNKFSDYDFREVE